MSKPNQIPTLSALHARHLAEERDLIVSAIDKAGSLSAAAELLDVSPSTLSEMRRRHGLPPMPAGRRPKSA